MSKIRVKSTLSDMRAIAESRGGEFLSNEFQGLKVKHQWRCGEGHEWNGQPQNIQRGSWCPECSGLKRKTIEFMQELAATKGGQLLSVEYIGINKNHRWRCGEGHEWEAIPNSVQRGSWCAECAGVKKKTLADMHALAASKGGEFLSCEHLGSRGVYNWRCHHKHEWRATYSSIKNQGSWCPMCARGGASVGERITREILEMMFRFPFPKLKPKWLGGGRGGLELDGFAEGIGVAFEYQGPQHYEAVAMYGGKEQLIVQQRRDSQKSKLCHENKVNLVVVPDFTDTRNLSGCIDQIEYAIICAGLKIPKGWKRPSDLPAIREPLLRIFGTSTVDELRAIAQAKGGALLSCDASKATDHLRWKCHVGHEWDSTIYGIKRGRWCLECSGLKLKTIADMRALAEAKGGEFLSPEYLGGAEKHRWRCCQGHEWETTPASVQHQGAWCHECAGVKRKTVSDMHALAASRGGEFLSKEYLYGNKLLWRCHEGHEWETNYSNIQQESWCPECAGVKKKTLADMHVLAALRGGEFLSDEYLGANERRVWRCGMGHEWEAMPNSISRGSWCPECAGLKRKTLADMHALAALRGGEFLSTEYLGTSRNHRWRCEAGHEWEAAPNNIKHGGTWCLECSGKKPRTLSDMQALADSRGGEFLSQEYVGMNKKHLWRCRKGHSWEAKPGNVQTKTWCPECARQKRKGIRELPLLVCTSEAPQ